MGRLGPIDGPLSHECAAGVRITPRLHRSSDGLQLSLFALAHESRQLVCTGYYWILRSTAVPWYSCIVLDTAATIFEMSSRRYRCTTVDRLWQRDPDPRPGRYRYAPEPRRTCVVPSRGAGLRLETPLYSCILAPTHSCALTLQYCSVTSNNVTTYSCTQLVALFVIYCYHGTVHVQ